MKMPIRLMVVGGFLGAGKTSAIARMAALLIQQGDLRAQLRCVRHPRLLYALVFKPARPAFLQRPGQQLIGHAFPSLP